MKKALYDNRLQRTARCAGAEDSPWRCLLEASSPVPGLRRSTRQELQILEVGC